MSFNVPDKWVVLKITQANKDVIYKVFGTWYGGFTSSEVWQINSGIVSCKELDGALEFEGYSGSIYRCYPSRHGLSGFGSNTIRNFKEQTKVHGVTIDIVEYQDFTKLEYPK